MNSRPRPSPLNPSARSIKRRALSHPPAIPSSTIYERSPDGSYRSGLAYTRADNPTYDHAERLLAALEGGVACMLFASGSAAATAVFQSLLPGDHVLVSRILYWGIRKWLAEVRSLVGTRRRVRRHHEPGAGDGCHSPRS